MPERASLERFVRRLREQPGFMAHVLQQYRAHERMGEEGLAAQLGIGAAALTRLALCKVPRPEPERFAADVQAIADFTGANATELVRILRTTAALTALHESLLAQQAEEPGEQPVALRLATRPGLVAARDREEEGYEARGDETGAEQPDEEAES